MPGTGRPRVAFLGPAGTHTEEALRASVRGEVEEVPAIDVHEAVLSVREGRADACVVPIENSLEGSVTTTVDLLADDAGGIRIAAEVVRPIRQALIARPGVALEEITRVLSHPQGLAQCARTLRERLPQAAQAVASSTAEAVRLVAAEDQPWAALASPLAAGEYGCEVVADGFEDEPGNVTRFVWLAPTGSEAAGPWPDGAPDKTSIVFWGFNDESPGALVAVLSELADRSINLTKIESRPRRFALGHYMFFADLEGATGSAVVDDALRALGGRVETLRILGSYPSGATN
ncbi:MAG: prephenate dehydratase [Thermoleophilaceae bacterium]|jgi:prephenate dehydratase|nr:prephenate dehydratase [Thermoleophilaceae bacterium]